MTYRLPTKHDDIRR